MSRLSLFYGKISLLFLSLYDKINWIAIYFLEIEV